MQEVVSKTQKQVNKTGRILTARGARPPPPCGGLCAVIYVNILSSSPRPRFDSDILEKDSFLLHFKAVDLA